MRFEHFHKYSYIPPGVLIKRNNMQKLIITPDCSTAEALEDFITSAQLSALPISYRFDLALTTALGVPDALRIIARKHLAPDRAVLLDLKLHDSAEVMARAITAAGRWSLVGGVTLHASAGRTAMKTAMRAAWDVGVLPVIAALPPALPRVEEGEIYGGINPMHKFLDQHLVLALKETGMPPDEPVGILCAPVDLPWILETFPLEDPIRKRLRLIVHNVLPDWVLTTSLRSKPMTPKEAVEDGVHHIVIDHLITNPPIGTSQFEVVRRILAELGEWPL